MSLRDGLTALACAVVTAAVYWLTFASHPTGDGYFYLRNLTTGDWDGLLNPTTLLTQVVWYRVWRLTGGDALGVIQAVNAVAAGLNAALMYAVSRRLHLGWRTSLCAAGLLAGSYAHWFFANGDAQHLSLTCLLVILWSATAEGKPTAHHLGLLGVLQGLAVLFRIENFLFGLVIAALLWLRWRDVAGILMYGLVGAGSLVATIGLTLERPGEYFSWFLRTRQYPQEYQGFAYAMWFDLPRALKGQITAWSYGVQPMVDVLRGLVSLDEPMVWLLGGLTVLAAVALVPSVAGAWPRFFRSGVTSSPAAAFAWAMVVWLGVYLGLHAIFWPTVTKYHLVSLPPLLLLVVLCRPPLALLVTATVLLACVNATGAIGPWWQYGQEKERLAKLALWPSISAESGIDPVMPSPRLSIKNECRRQPAGCLDEFRRYLSLSDLGPIYVYNFIPADYTLIGLRMMTRGQAPSRQDFIALDAELRRAYRYRPVAKYWEHAYHPLYLYGLHLDTVWEVTAR